MHPGPLYNNRSPAAARWGHPSPPRHREGCREGPTFLICLAGPMDSIRDYLGGVLLPTYGPTSAQYFTPLSRDNESDYVA